MTIFFVSSSRASWFEHQDAEFHFKSAPYSVDAIGWNLAKLGWNVRWAGWPSSHNPLHLARLIDEIKPDIIYTYGSTVALHPLVCRKFLCKHRAFKVVHGWDDPYGRLWGDMFGWPGKLLMDWMEKCIVKNSDGVVTLSYELQKKGRMWGIDCHYIPNGADPIPSTFSLQSPTVRLDGAFNLVYTGDKSKWKRADDICKAMQKLPKDVKLYMTGNEPDYLKPYWSENCISLGWVTKEEQLAVMSQADAFVCTSNQDCNAKLQEYLRWKKPILGFDGEANNFFRNGHNALLAKNGDYAPLVRRLIGEPELGPTLAANAAAEIPVYTWAEIAQQFDAYFRNLLSSSHAQGTGNPAHDGSKSDDSGGLHPFMARRERAMADFRRIRVLAEAAAAQSGGVADCCTGDSLRALVSVAQESGLYVNPKDIRGFGELVSKRTGESSVYFNDKEDSYYKVKSPFAKAPIKHTVLADCFFEHVVHNVLFPESRYDFVGVSEESGELRIVLKQSEIPSLAFPTDEQVSAHLAGLGLKPEDRYFFGNEVLAVTDVGAHGDNVLVGTDGKLYFIDPLIRLKKPAIEVLEWLVGKVV